MADILGVTGDDQQTGAAASETFVFPILVNLGEQFRRKGAKPAVAISQVRITLRDQQDVTKCIQALRESDAALAQKPDLEVLYDWQMAACDGSTVVFGVAGMTASSSIHARKLTSLSSIAAYCRALE